MPITLCRERGLRLDRVIECEVLPHPGNQSKNLTLLVGYQYKIFGDERMYRAEFKLDLAKM
jgi:hypothetical protein